MICGPSGWSAPPSFRFLIHLCLDPPMKISTTISLRPSSISTTILHSHDGQTLRNRIKFGIEVTSVDKFDGK